MDDNSTGTVRGIITPYNVGQYCGGCSVLWGVASVLRRLFSTVGDSISTAEAVQYCGGITSVLRGIASVLWRLFSTDSCSTCGGIASVLWRLFSTVEG